MRCDVATSTNGIFKIQQAAENNPYTLVFVDFVMHGKNAYDWIHELRQFNEINKTPIILMSSMGMVLNHDKINELGVVSTLTKPIRKIKLHDCIVAALIKIRALPNTLIDHIAEQKSSLPKQHILLAEDNQINRVVALRILNNLGYQVDMVENGLEAIEAIKKTSYDLILIDCQMPKMDGFTATKKIREMENVQQKHTPIIAMTAYALEGDREKCLAAGMDDYIPKPLDVKLLAKTVKEWITDAQNTTK